MQVVLHVGGNVFNQTTLMKVLDKLGNRLINHKTQLGVLSSIWDADSTEENLIRNSNHGHQIFLSFIVVSKIKHLLNMSIDGLSASTISIRDDEAVILCTASLVTWKNIVLKLLGSGDTNELGEMILQSLENLGYSGIFHTYNRRRVGNNLKLEYKPC